MGKLYIIALWLLTLVSVSGAAEVPAKAGDVRPLLVGTQAPAPAGLLDDQGVAFDFAAALADKPTVVVFYRGHW